ncbi:MAG: Na/Pi cotransporter family protein [Acetobacteraceae bacterium]
MDLSLTLIDLAGFVALLLWGVHMVQTGVQRAFGPRLRLVLGAALRTRVKGFAAGLGVTAILQSSTATALMVTGFAAAGLVSLVSGLGVMLGANVGTTLIVQVLSLNVAAAAPALVLVGVVMFRRGQESRWRDLGRTAIGLGLVLLALHEMLVLLEPMEQGAGLRLIAGVLANQPVLALVLGALLAWAAHSSATVVLLVMSLAASLVLPLHAALAMTLGANLGTAINPCLEGGAGDDREALRLPLGNLGFRIVSCACVLPALDPIGRFFAALEPNPARAVADFHTLFNLAAAVVFLPLLSPYAALLRRLLPARAQPTDPTRPAYLDPDARSNPVVAIGAAARESLRLADVLESMLVGLRDALRKADRKRIGETRRLDDVLDALNTAVKTYLISLDDAAMTAADHRRANEVLSFATNIEQAGDVIERNLLGHVAKLNKRGLAFSAEGLAEMLAMLDRLVANLRASAIVFMSDDPRAARLLAAEKQGFRDLETAATVGHFDRLRAGRVETAETSALHLDMIRDLKRVNAHLVAAAAYPVLEGQGELLASRVRE